MLVELNFKAKILDFTAYTLPYHTNHHQSLNREGRWGTTDDFTTTFLYFSVFHHPLGLSELQARPFPGGLTTTTKSQEGIQ